MGIERKAAGSMLAFRSMGAVALMALAAAALNACDWFGDDEVRLEGERIPVMVHEDTVRPDVELANVAVRLPSPKVNPAWPDPGGNPGHNLQHLELPDELHRVWSAEVGEGSSSTRVLLSPPVVAAGRVFTMDVEATVTALSTENGQEIWSRELLLEEEDESAIGGGIAYDSGRLFVTTGFAQALALDAETGDELWRKSLPGPMRAAPTVADGRVFVLTVDNQLHVLDAANGNVLWTHSGIIEIAGLLGGASPAVAKGVVVVAYSSGEIYALRIANGRELWSDNLSPVHRADAAQAITDIRGLPVIDGERVYAIGNGGRMVAVDLRTGQRVWDKAFGGVQTPWVVGDYVYVLSTASELVCIYRPDGRIRWVVALRRYRDVENREGPIVWSGPVLAGDRLVVAGSHGEALAISPYTGDLLGKLGLPAGVTVPPVVADGTLYILTDQAQLIALR